MDWTVAVGCACLGILIGLLVGFYVNEAKQMDYRVLQGAIWVLAGTGVIAVFSLLGGIGTVTREYWLYPVGLIVGFVLAPVCDVMHNRLYESPRKPNRN